MYGRQVQDLYDHFPREQVLLLRYKSLVDEPDKVLNRVFGFLGVETQEIDQIPSDNSRVFVRDGVRARTVGPVIRAGATVGQFLPPKVWRTVSKPLISQLHKGGDPRGRSSPRSSASCCWPRTSRTSPCSSRSPASRSSSGGPTATAAPSRAAAASRQAEPGQGRLSVVTRSCAPSGRASSK